jgi:hypothetical protein
VNDRGELTAIHEAAHAVVGRELGLNPSRVELRPGDGGTCFYSGLPAFRSLGDIRRLLASLSAILRGSVRRP